MGFCLLFSAFPLFHPVHIALIIDDERLLHERIMLSRLCVGLIDVGCTLTRIVPAQPETTGDEPGHSELGLAARINVPMNVLPWMRKQRAQGIAQTLQRAMPDVLYAVGYESWQVALDLTKQIERPVALNVWCTQLLRQLPHHRSAEYINAYIAPTRRLVDALRERVEPELVSYVPQGVAVPPEPWPVFAGADQTVSLAVVGGGADLVSYRALLGGLSRVFGEHGNVHVFMELRGPQQHEIWRHANRLEMLSRVSAITDAAQFRTLLTQCDVLILPERMGELRSLVLEAMAMGLPVIAARDPMLNMLVSGETALVVEEPEPEPWSEAIRKLLSSHDFARELGLAGRRYVQENHRSSDQVAALLETLGQVVHGGSIDFMSDPQ